LEGAGIPVALGLYKSNEITFAPLTDSLNKTFNYKIKIKKVA